MALEFSKGVFLGGWGVGESENICNAYFDIFSGAEYFKKNYGFAFFVVCGVRWMFIVN